MKLSKIPSGFKRKWVKCNYCGKPAYYLYQPFSLSFPVLTLPCGHGTSERWTEATTQITFEEAKALLNKQESAQ